MILDRQAASPERPAATAGGRIVAIASGKGGVGKTWFSITLAHVMARAGRRVMLFDGDLGLANVDIQLGLVPGRDIGAFIAGRIPLAAAITPVLDGGFDVLPGRSGSGAFAALDETAFAALRAGLRAAAARYDFVLLDLGAGIDTTVRQFSAFADTLLVVATEEPTSLTDAYAALKLHAADSPRGDARIVVNQATSRTSGERTYGTLAKACATFLGKSPVLAGIIRRDDRVRDAIRRQTLLLLRHPGAHAAADVELVARGINAAPASLRAPAIDLAAIAST